MNNIASEKKKKLSPAFWVLIGIVGFITLSFVGFFLMIAGILSAGGSSTLDTGNVAVIDISGVILTQGQSGYMAQDTSSENVVDLIKKADESKNIDAIMFIVNSPGGSGVAADEIGQAILETNKTTVAVIREVGASAAYWIASATDRIYANRLSAVGSIGVTMSHLGFEDFIEEHNVTYRRLVSTKYKDIGTPFRAITKEEEAFLQNSLDRSHDVFVSVVAENRNMKKSEAEELASGLFWMGEEALELGLIDEIGGVNQAAEYIKEQINGSVELVEYRKDPSLSEILFGTISGIPYQMGKGIGEGMFSTKSNGITA